MADALFNNNAFSLLTSGISDSVTTLSITASDGALFPSPTGGDYFYATLIDTSNNLEIIKVTTRSTDTFSVIARGQEGTTARAFVAGDRVELRITAGGLTDVITQATTQATLAAASAAASLVSEGLADTDATATAADAVSTAADAVSTAADLVTMDTALSAIALPFTFSTTTSMADPGAGIVRFNSGTIASVTAMAFDATSAATGNPDVSDFLAMWDDISGGTNKGIIFVIDENTPANFASFYITAMTDNTGWLQATVVHIASGGTTFTNGVIVRFAYSPAGPSGAGLGDLLAANNLSDVDTFATAFNNIKQAATTSATGVVQIATNAQVNTGTSTTLMVTPDAVEQLVTGATTATIAAGDEILFADVDDSNNKKKDTVQGILDLVSGGFGLETTPVMAGGMTARTTNGAAAGLVELPTNDVMLRTFDFDTSTDEFVQFTIPMPKRWDAGTITANFLWTAAAGSAAETVVWGIQAVAFANDDAMDTAFGTAQVGSDALIAINDLHISPTTSAITVAGSPAAEEVVYFQVYRDVSADNLPNDAKLIGVNIFWTSDTDDDT